MTSAPLPNGVSQERACFRRAVVVLGVGRSGIDELTRVLNMCHCADRPNRHSWTGSQVTGPRISNELTTLVHKIVQTDKTNKAKMGEGARPSASFTSRNAVQYEDEFRSLVDELFAENDIVVINSPHLFLLRSLFEKTATAVGAEVNYVICVHKPEEVANSFGEDLRCAPSDAMHIGCRYVLDAERATRGASRVFVPFDDFFANWRAETRRVGEALGIQWPIRPNSIESEIDNLVARRRKCADVNSAAWSESPETAETVKTVYQLLRKAAKGQGLDTAKLDAARQSVGAGARITNSLARQIRSSKTSVSEKSDEPNDRSTSKRKSETNKEAAESSVKRRLAFDDLLIESLFRPERYAPASTRDEYLFSFMSSYASHCITQYADREHDTLVSFIMPTYNRRHCISQAIDSVRSQTYENWELLIVDDCSTDGTADLVGSYDDDRIRFIRLDENRGSAGARNAAIDSLSGEYVTYIDTDNTIDKNFLLILVNKLKDNPALDVVYCGQRAFEVKENTVREKFVRFAPFHRPTLENRNYIDIGVLLHRVKVFEEVGCFNGNMQRLADWEFILRCTEEKAALAVPVILSDYYYSKSNDQNTKRFGLTENLKIVQGSVRGEPLSNSVLSLNEPSGTNMYSLPNAVREPEIRRNVSIIIPSFESIDFLRPCVEAILAFTGRYTYELIIVDNNSSRPVTSFLATLANSGVAKVIFNKNNMGFTYAVNQGIEETSPGHDIVLMNNDAVVTAGWMDALQTVFARHPEAGIAVPRQVVPPGEKTLPVHHPSAAKSRECDVNISAHHANLLDPLFDPESGEFEIAYAPFFCVYIARETINAVGKLDVANGPHYRSDRLYCDIVRTLTDAKIIYTPKSKVYHYVQKATNELKANDARGYENLFVKNDWNAVSAGETAGDGRRHEVEEDQAERRLLSETSLFDAEWYLTQYPEIASTGVDPVWHYLLFGAPAGLDPSPLFDSDWYVQYYPDVARAGLNPLVHYIKHGDREGRRPHALFDTAWYRAMYPSSLNAATTTLEHYINEGASEGCNPHFEFDSEWYLAHYRDVGERGINPLAHYVREGIWERRLPNPDFSLERLPDDSGNDSVFEAFRPAERGRVGKILRYDAPTDKPPIRTESVCVHLHLFYTDLAEHFSELLKRIENEYVLLLSIPEGESTAEWEKFFGGRVEQITHVDARNVPNHGRDVAPWVVEFREQIKRHTILLHLHSKKSPHRGPERDWRDFLEHALIGSTNIVNQILHMFTEDRSLGLVYPPYFGGLRTTGWGDNFEAFTDVYRRLTSDKPPAECPDFPAGSFFWARVATLLPLLNLELAVDDFVGPDKRTDGTLAHAIERLVGALPGIARMEKRCVAVDVAYNLVTEENSPRLSASERLRSKNRLVACRDD